MDRMRRRREGPYRTLTDPAYVLCTAPKVLGRLDWNPDAATLATHCLFYALCDAGVDSLRFCALSGLFLKDMEPIVNPANYAVPTARQATLIDATGYDTGAESNAVSYAQVVEFLADCLGHPFAEQLAAQWIKIMVSVNREFDGSVLDFLRRDAQKVYRDLNSPRYPGYGPKKSRVLLARLHRARLIRYDLGPIGPGIDRHGLSLGVGMDFVRLDGPASCNPVITALHFGAIDACEKAQISPSDAHVDLWGMGRGYCREVKCSACPFWKSACRGRVSLRGYNTRENGGRWIDPDRIIAPQLDFDLDLGAEGMLQGPNDHLADEILKLVLGTDQPTLPLSYTN